MKCPECNGSGETIYFVEIDRDENSATVEKRKGICRMCNGSGEKPFTNGDRIRAMSDEELAIYFSGMICDINEGVEYHENPNTWLEWLQQPAEVQE